MLIAEVGSRDKMIPRVLHQTWKNEAVPASFADYVASWKHLHPGWDFKLWTDADLAALVDARFPEYRALFHGYPKPIMRVDLGRYLILRELGGVYSDLDAEAAASFDPLCGSERPLFAYEPQSHAARAFIRSRGFRSVVSNAVMLSPAGHPFWDHLLRLLQRCRCAGNPLDATGPFVLTEAVEQAPPAAAPRVLPAHVFPPFDKFGAPVDHAGSALPTLAVHHWAGTWWRPQTPDQAVPPLASKPTVLGVSAAAAKAGIRGLRSVKRDLVGAVRRTARGLSAIASSRQGVAQESSVADLVSDAEAAEFIRSIDRSAITSASPKRGNVLVAVPVRDATDTLEVLFERLLALRYPRAQLSLAFLEGDSSDDSLARLHAFALRHADGFRRLDVVKYDVGDLASSTPRWEPAAQRSRRTRIARVRNELLRRSLQDEDWVLWVDADIIGFPDDILATLLATGARIAHPNAVRQPGGESMDLNAWTIERQLTHEAMTPWIRDGLFQPPVGFQRLYLSDLRYRDEVVLDSVGGTMLLVDADLHRAGLLFPESPYRYLIETEAFGAAARDIGILPVGLPNVEILHSPR